ncbi:DUF4192 family protein [uncultured Pseudokineococcus sp.]|uniref:DUF4192 family protein n=1 Tax=uncultured Pseudokineococcus sp. TaxID=1642928 RepID=UPI002603F0BA|nr:DUF4192 family protein [uncultured Pseudokineococcus sp.]
MPNPSQPPAPSPSSPHGRSAGGGPPAVLRVSDPRELLALVPHQLGFTPRRSVVLVCLRGERRRVGLVVRADLPAVDERERRLLAAHRVEADLVDRLGAVVDRLVALAVRDGAAAVVAVVYDDPAAPDPGAAAPVAPDPGATHPLLPGAAASGEDARDTSVAGLVEVLLGGACATAGVALADVWWVDGHRFRSLGCREERCCPAAGEPLEALDGTVVAAEMVSRGSSPAGARESLLDDLRPAGAEARLDAARSAASARRRARRAAGEPPRAARVRAEALAGLRAAAEVERLAHLAREEGGRGGGADELHDPALLGRLAAALRDPWLRDALLVSLVPGAGDLPEQLVLTGPDERAEALLETVVGDPGGAREPDPALLEPTCAVLAAVVRHLPGAAGADALAALAWAAWWSGDGARAVSCAERALEARAGTPMAELVLDLVDAGAAPAWVRARRDAEVAGGADG